ncbi:MAG: TolB family protein [Cyanophyceae cyanobacterium]
MKRLIVAIFTAIVLSSCHSYPSLSLESGRGLNSPASESAPQIAAQYLVFVSERKGSQEIYLFDTQERRLLDLPGLNSLDAIASHPAITEDGRWIVFAAIVDGKTGIYLYDRETQQKRNLTANLQAEVRNPTMSADGSTIAFEVGTEGRWGIELYTNSELIEIP